MVKVSKKMPSFLDIRSPCVAGHCLGSARARDSFSPTLGCIRVTETDAYHDSVWGTYGQGFVHP